MICRLNTRCGAQIRLLRRHKINTISSYHRQKPKLRMHRCRFWMADPDNKLDNLSEAGDRSEKSPDTWQSHDKKPARRMSSSRADT